MLAADNKDKRGAAIDALIKLLGEPGAHGDELSAAVEALGVLAKDSKDKQSAAIDALIIHLGDAYSDVRCLTAQALGELVKVNKDRSSDVIDALIKQLDDGNRDARSAAAEALRVLLKDNKDRSSDVIASLINRLGDENPSQERLAAAEALGVLAVDNKNASSAAIAALTRRLGDAYFETRGVAARALSLLATENNDKSTVTIDALVERLGDGVPDVLGAAAEALAVFVKYNKDRSSAAIDALIKRLDDSNSDIHSAAAQALGVLAKDNKAKSSASIDALISGLSDGNLYVRREVVHALGALASENQDKSSATIDALIPSLRDNDWGVHQAAAEALLVLVKNNRGKSNDVIDALIERLGGDNADWDLRRTAVRALGVLAKDNEAKRNAVIAALIQRLGDGDLHVQRAAEGALAAMPEPLGEPDILVLLDLATYLPPNSEPMMEASFHILSGGDHGFWPLQPVLLKVQPDKYKDPEATLERLITVWPKTKQGSELRQQIARIATRIAHRPCAADTASSAEAATWLPVLSPILRDVVNKIVANPCLSPRMRDGIKTLSQYFGEEKLDQANDLDLVSQNANNQERLASVAAWSAKIIAVHGGLWFALLLLYPRYLWVQAVFFWNPWVRRLLGLHLSMLIPLLPFARRRLLAPFRPALGPKSNSAGAKSVAETAWFSEAEVTEGDATERVPIVRALPIIRGLTVLEGVSGLGKTVYLVRLALDSKRVVAFVKAGEEDGKVIKAVAARLPAEVMRDEAFLRMLIHAGGLDICIDGLNEVSAEVRAEVASFAQAATRANIIISTQLIRWNRPAGARLLQLQPLRPKQREEFLLSREIMLPKNAPVRGKRFRECVHAFVHEMETTLPTDVKEGVARERSLNNPMDLTTIALILAGGGAPDLLNLQRTVYLQAADQYRAENQGAEFPLTGFSEYVYDQRCRGVGQERELIVLREPRFAAECDVLADHRLLLKTAEAGADGKEAASWQFRHDKVLDFFLYVAITNPAFASERARQHVGDTRFRGVYLLLALREPLDRAKEIRDHLADYATDTRDHVLSDEFWGIVKQRLDAAPGPERTEQMAAAS